MHRVGEARPGLVGSRRPERATVAVAVESRPHAHTITVCAAGKPVGRVDPSTGVFSKRCRGSVHMLRVPLRGWALDIRSLDDAERAGATIVEIRDVESTKVYRASLSRIRRDGTLVDLGFGEQLALPLTCWSVSDDGQLRLPLWSEP